MKWFLRAVVLQNARTYGRSSERSTGVRSCSNAKIARPDPGCLDPVVCLGAGQAGGIGGMANDQAGSGLATLTNDQPGSGLAATRKLQALTPVVLIDQIER